MANGRVSCGRLSGDGVSEHPGEAVADRQSRPFSKESFDGVLPGRYSFESAARVDGSPRVFSCRAHRVAIDHMDLEGPVCGEIGERVKAWIAHFDLLTGTISAVGRRNFTVRFHMPPRQRPEFAKKIAWVRGHVQEGVPDLRHGQRLPMPLLEPVFILGSGAMHDCFIIDASPTGAAISANHVPEPGTRLAVGSIVGTVVRLIETGFAMQFDEEQAPETLRQVLGWMPPQLRGALSVGGQ